ncbi:MAG: hypothetical protein IT330_00280 [Anaerolineae bacterium]|nr:hypothetical protein [Anaerolineae bacterium]
MAPRKALLTLWPLLGAFLTFFAHFFAFARAEPSATVPRFPPGFYTASDSAGKGRTVSLVDGIHRRWAWCFIEPTGPGEYDWSIVEDWLAGNDAANKKSVFSLLVKEEPFGTPWANCTAAAPPWVLTPPYGPIPYSLTVTTTVLLLNYDHPNVQQALARTIAALGARYNGDSRIPSVQIGAGHWSENRPYARNANWDGSCPFCPLDNGAAEKQVYMDAWGGGGTAPLRWLNYLRFMIDQHLAAFPSKPLVIQVAGSFGLDDRTRAFYNGQTYIQYAANRGIGFFNTGMTYDLLDGNGEDRIPNGASPIPTIFINWPNVFKYYAETARATIGLAAEHGGHDWPGDFSKGQYFYPWAFYWMVLDSLDKHIDYIQVLGADAANPANATAIRFFQRHAGKTLANTPGVFIAFRDTEGTYRPDGCNRGAIDCESNLPLYGWGRQRPNYEFWVYEKRSAPGSASVVGGLGASAMKGDPYRLSPWAFYLYRWRRTDVATGNRYISLDIDDGWPHARQKPLSEPGGTTGYTVTVTYRQDGGLFRLEYKGYDGARRYQERQKENTAQGWGSYSFVLTDAYLDNGLEGGADMRLYAPGAADTRFHIVYVEAFQGVGGIVMGSRPEERDLPSPPTPLPQALGRTHEYTGEGSWPMPSPLRGEGRVRGDDALTAPAFANNVPPSPNPLPEREGKAYFLPLVGGMGRGWMALEGQDAAAPTRPAGFPPPLRGGGPGWGPLVSTSWLTATTGVTRSLYALAFADATRAYAAGADGTLLRTTDGGQTWNPRPSPGFGTALDIFFYNATHGWAVTNQGWVWRTTNGGDNWTPHKVFDAHSLRAVHFADSLRGWAVGDALGPDGYTYAGAVYATANGGVTWARQYLAGPLLHGLHVAPDGQTGLAVGDGGTVLRTGNGGLNWVVTPSATLRTLHDVRFVTQSQVWTVGGDHVGQENGVNVFEFAYVFLQSWDGGQTWAVAQEGYGAKFNRVRVGADGLGWAAGVRGALWWTFDGGLSWEPVASGTRENLYALDFSAGGGLAAGAWGTARRYDLASPEPTPTFTPTSTPTSSLTSTETPTPTPTETATPTPTETPTPTPSVTPTATDTPTATPSPSATPVRHYLPLISRVLRP